MLFSIPCGEARCCSPSATTHNQPVALAGSLRPLKGTHQASTQNNGLRVCWLGALIHHFHSPLFCFAILNCTAKIIAAAPSSEVSLSHLRARQRERMCFGCPNGAAKQDEGRCSPAQPGTLPSSRSHTLICQMCDPSTNTVSLRGEV